MGIEPLQKCSRCSSLSAETPASTSGDSALGGNSCLTPDGLQELPTSSNLQHRSLQGGDSGLQVQTLRFVRRL